MSLISGVAKVLNKTYVVNRRGERVAPRWDQITERIEELCADPACGPELPDIDAPMLTRQVMTQFENGMSTRDLDDIVVGECAARAPDSEQWTMLAARIGVSDLHKRTPAALTATLAAMAASPSGAARVMSRLSPEYLGIVKRFGPEIDARLVAARDYRFRVFGLQTAKLKYLLRNIADGNVDAKEPLLVERPGHWYMRVALTLFCAQADGLGHEAPDAVARARLARALDYYDALSLHRISHATPTMLNAGTRHQQMSSCFQLATGDDMDALMRTHMHAGQTSKWAGGMSLWVSNVRAEGALIAGTGGASSGIKRYLRCHNELIQYVDQGGNRPGAEAIYLEPWHADIFTFLRIARLREQFNASQLKYAVYASDSFILAVLADADWWLMTPDVSPGLFRVHGAAFDALYQKYIAEGKFVRKLKAREIFVEIWQTVRQMGHPYLLLKDRINAMSNMSNVATICSSNLCAEITIPSWSDHDAESFGRPKGEGEHGVCNLGAMCLENYLVEGKAPSVMLTHSITHVPELKRQNETLSTYALFPAEHQPTRHDEKRADELLPVAKRVGGGLKMPPIEIDALAGVYSFKLNPADHQPTGQTSECESVHVPMARAETAETLDNAVKKEISAHMNKIGVWVDYKTAINHPTSTLDRLVDIIPATAAAPPRAENKLPPLERVEGAPVDATPNAAPQDLDGDMTGAMKELSAHMDKIGVWIDFKAVIDYADQLATALDRLIDINYSPTSTEGPARDPGARSNRRHRPIAVGCMGLADVIMRLDLIYGSPMARAADRAIAAATYYGAMRASSRGGEADGHYPSFYDNGGSPASRGMLQPDIWAAAGKYNTANAAEFAAGKFKFDHTKPQAWEAELEPLLGGLVDWGVLRARLKRGWLRNAYVTAYMPTATTSNIIGMNECFEPFTSNIYIRKTLSGDHIVASRHLERDLRAAGLWSAETRARLKASRSSVQGFTDWPLHLRRKYRLAVEIDIRLLLLHGKARAPFTSQSMSINGYDTQPTVETLLTRAELALKLGLPIAWYYVHSTVASAGHRRCAHRRC